eukprot:243023-Chlamydomonas_euryale.AAC.1
MVTVGVRQVCGVAPVLLHVLSTIFCKRPAHNWPPPPPPNNLASKSLQCRQCLANRSYRIVALTYTDDLALLALRRFALLCIACVSDLAFLA